VKGTLSVFKRLSNFVASFMLCSFSLFWIVYPIVGQDDRY